MKQKITHKYIAVFDRWDMETTSCDPKIRPRHIGSTLLTNKIFFNTKEELIKKLTCNNSGIVEVENANLDMHMYHPANSSPGSFVIEWLSDTIDSGLAPDKLEIELWKEGTYDLALNTLTLKVYKLEEVTELE